MPRVHIGRRTQRLSRLVIGATLLLGAVAAPGAAPNAATLGVRVSAVQEPPLKQYRAYRRMHARNDQGTEYDFGYELAG